MRITARETGLSLVAKDEKAFKNLNFRTYYEIVQLKASQLETVRKFKQWDDSGRDTSHHVQTPRGSSDLDFTVWTRKLSHSDLGSYSWKLITDNIQVHYLERIIVTSIVKWV